MKRARLWFIFLLALLFVIGTVSFGFAAKPLVKFDSSKVSSMTDFDPNNPVIPTGDTIKIAVVAGHSGPGAGTGEQFWLAAQWAAHDYNSRGGIWVDGKKKLVQIIKADHAGKPAQMKQICEKMALQEKVHVLWGAEGSHMVKIMNATAAKYKVISQNMISQSDDLMDSINFTPYAFQTFITTNQTGRGFGYYFGQQRKKEKKFYILCQDYLFGHELAEAFKKGLKEYYPGAEIVGEDYHKLFLTDFAPYITKIKASGAEVVFTGDWVPDLANLLKQGKQMGLKINYALNYPPGAGPSTDLGIEGTKGLIYMNWYSDGNPVYKTPALVKSQKRWHDQWKKWKPPFNKENYEHGVGYVTAEMYWLLSVIERARSTDPEKIIKVWEGDRFEYEIGHEATMRPCDHVAVQKVAVNEFVPPDQQKVSFNVPPYYWNDKYCFYGTNVTIPVDKVYPIMDPKLERCKGAKISGD